MNTMCKRFISVFLTVFIILSAAPLCGFAGLDLNFDWFDFNTKASALDASGQCGENVYYSFDSSTGTLTISGSGAMFNYDSNNSPFCRNYNIQTVVVANGVTSIGEYMFYYCSELTSVTIPSGVTYIGDCAFQSCSSLTSITIPDSVTSIGNSVFSFCTGLTTVNYNAENCTSMGSYGYSVFFGCKSFAVLNIGDNTKIIPDYAFYNCSGLTSITIPHGVTKIGYEAFYRCTGFTSVTIPDSVTSIDNYAFDLVANIVYNGSATGAPWGAKTVNGYIEYPLIYSDSSKTVISACSLSYEGEFVISDSVTRIRQYAFYRCTGLTSLSIPDSVTSIGNYAFSDCTGLMSVMIPNSVTSIGYRAIPSNTVVYGYDNSAAHLYAQNNSLQFVSLYTIAFDGNGGKPSLSNKAVAFQEEYGDLPDAQRIGFAFAGWFTEAENGEKKESESIYNLTENQTLYAHWTSKEIESISIDLENTKTEYYLGETFDSSLITLVITYVDGTSETANEGFLCSTPAINKVSKKLVTVELNGFRITFIIQIKAPELNSISVVTMPSKTSYFIGEALNSYGLQVMALYKNGYSQLVEGYTLDYDFSTSGAQTVTVTYTENGETQITAFIVTVENAATVYADEVTCDAGSTISVPVKIIGNTGLMGFGMTISYDADVLTPVSVEKEMALPGMMNDSIETSAAGSFDVFWADSDGFTSDGVLFIVTFRVEANAYGDYSINISYKEDETFNENWDTVNLNCVDVNLHISNSSGETARIFSNNITAVAGATVSVPIQIVNNNGFNSDTIAINYNPAVFTPASVSEGNSSVVSTDFTQEGIAYVNIGSTSQDGVLFTIDFVVNETASGEYTLTLISGNNIQCDPVLINVITETTKISMTQKNTDEEYVTAAINISGNTGIMGLRLNITYDSSYLTPVSVSRGNELAIGNSENTISNNTVGYFSIIWFGADDFTADGELFTVRFRKAKPFNDATQVGLAYVQDDTYNSAWEDVPLECKGMTALGKTTGLLKAVNGSGTIIDYLNNYVYGLTSGLTTLDGRVETDEGFSFVVNKATKFVGTETVVTVMYGETEVENYTVILFGDVNNDGWYDGQDSFIVNCITYGMLSREQVGEAKWMAADCDHDGEITAIDVAILEQAGLLLVNVDQTASQNELMQSDSYIEYLNLIDQNPAGEEPIIEEPTEPDLAPVAKTLIEKIIEVVKTIITFIRGLFPKI